MPGMYAEGDYDLAGFCVGAVERDKVLTGADSRPGDVILGLASSGVHSNGFSLVRRIIADSASWELDEPALFDQAAERSARSCSSRRGSTSARSCRSSSSARIKGLAHITGGGLLENIPRVLPESCHAS
jgi:phosphoribosylformylglycinamidine cyclo-ligase